MDQQRLRLSEQLPNGVAIDNETKKMLGKPKCNKTSGLWKSQKVFGR
jgi:hypothetical protein